MTRIAADSVAAEEAIVFGAGSRLVGIVTTPPRGVQANLGTAAILFNAGVVHHVGPNRLWVTLARHLARSGFTVLRFDHSGIGDSLPREDDLTFEKSSVLEAQDAIDWLAAERGCTSFVLVGLCSGTLTAFRAAQSDPRVASLILLTALLQDPSTVPPEMVAEASDRRVVRSYLTEKLTSRGTWLKFLTGEANYGRIWRTLRRTLLKRSRRARLDPGTTDVITQMEGMLERGVSTFFIFAEPTTVLEYFRMTLEPELPALRRHGRIEATVLRRADHTFSQLRHQKRVIELIADWLERGCS